MAQVRDDKWQLFHDAIPAVSAAKGGKSGFSDGCSNKRHGGTQNGSDFRD